LVGLKRVVKTVDWRSVLRESPGSEDNQQDSPAQDSLLLETGETGEAGGGSDGSSNEMAQIAAMKESPDTGKEPVMEPVMSGDGTGENK
jgi:hypothetical protein